MASICMYMPSSLTRSLAAVPGTGVSLYFHFLRSMGIFFLLASLLHVPHVLFCYYGNRLGVYKIGSTHMGAFTAANHLIRYPYVRNPSLWLLCTYSKGRGAGNSSGMCKADTN